MLIDIFFFFLLFQLLNNGTFPVVSIDLLLLSKSCFSYNGVYTSLYKKGIKKDQNNSMETTFPVVPFMDLPP